MCMQHYPLLMLSLLTLMLLSFFPLLTAVLLLLLLVAVVDVVAVVDAAPVISDNLKLFEKEVLLTATKGHEQGYCFYTEAPMIFSALAFDLQRPLFVFGTEHCNV
jgi:hypothetical protein